MSLLFSYYKNLYVQNLNISLTIILVKTVYCPVIISEPHVRFIICGTDKIDAFTLLGQASFQTSYSRIKQNLSLFSTTFSQSRCLAWYAGSIKSEARVVMHATLFSVIRP